MKALLNFSLILITLLTICCAAKAATAAPAWVQVNAPATATPLGLSGWDSDLIAEQPARYRPPPTPGFDGGGYLWIEETPGHRGFPSSRRFMSAYNAQVVFQLQPFGGANVLLLSSAIEPPPVVSQYVKLPERPTGTLTLVQPSRYSFLAVAASSGGGGGIGTVVLNFADGTSSREFPLMAPDWWNHGHSDDWIDSEPPGAVAISGLSRIQVGNPGFDDGVYQGVGEGFALYESDIDLAGEGLSSKMLTSITFTKPPAILRKLSTGPWTTGIFAVSGVLNEPSVTEILNDNTAGVQLKVKGPTNIIVQVDVSDDLKSWKPITSVTNSVGTVQVTDSQPPAAEGRFYRAIRAQ